MAKSPYSHMDREQARRYYIEEVIVNPIVGRLQAWKPGDESTVKFEIKVDPDLIEYLFPKQN